MNLADIRKKAQRERLKRDTAAVGSGPVVQHETQPLSAVPTFDPPLTETTGSVSVHPQPAEPFDPLGVIQSGREAVRAASRQEVVPESVPKEEPAGFLSFTIGGETYAIEIERVRETIRPRRVTPVPRAPESITGIISHRGTIISVLDLSKRVGLEQRAATSTGRIIVVRNGGGLCGLLVDGVGRVVMVPPSAVEPAPAMPVAENREFVSGIVRHRGAMLILLDLDKVLDIGLRST
jgi:purine-binding chemotaxis protein CheW